jgi:hypothetical protein
MNLGIWTTLFLLGVVQFSRVASYGRSFRYLQCRRPKIDGILGEDVLKEFAKLEIAELVSKGLPDVRQPTVCCRGAEGLVIGSQKSEKSGQQIQQFASPEETPF